MPAKPDGAACNDGNGCTQTDTCQAGACIGSNAVVCGALDQCHVAGTCSPATGSCTQPTRGDGTSCDDGNGCTLGDVCMTGVCASGAAMTCPAGTCQMAGTCAAGVCSPATPLPDGTACAMGMCTAGSCVFPDGGSMPDAGRDGGTDAGTDAGTDGGADAGSDAGTDAAITGDASVVRDASVHDAGHDASARDGAIDASPDAGSVAPPSNGGCGCAVPSHGGAQHGGAWLAIGLALALIRRRRRLTRT
jgi:MYXO-CTERM domain-containing protein